MTEAERKALHAKKALYQQEKLANMTEAERKAYKARRSLYQRRGGGKRIQSQTDCPPTCLGKAQASKLGKRYFAMFGLLASYFY
mmetsp:Transcript_4517/g.10081  ORF Transcript_4517/g.10081 Transcript_4517/m.10081 type:complete len:84 (-) Transcript_4517:20-271(-)